MSVQPLENAFDCMEPHRHLPADLRGAFWAAGVLVRERPAAFAEALAWLHEDYSEGAVRGRLLRRVEKRYRAALCRIREGLDLCDMFPRRLALRAMAANFALERRRRLLRRFCAHRTFEYSRVPDEFVEKLLREPAVIRQWLTELTVGTARARGWRLEGDAVVTRNPKNENNVVGAENVETVWRWLDDQCLRAQQAAKARRNEGRAEADGEARDKVRRLRLAVEDATEADLPAGEAGNRWALRVVLLGCLLTQPEHVALPGELCAWSWDSEGELYGQLTGGLPFVAGREGVLFAPEAMRRGAEVLALPVSTVAAFGNLLQRALVLCGGSEESGDKVKGAVDRETVVVAFERLSVDLTAMVKQRIPEDAALEAERRKLSGHHHTDRWVFWQRVCERVEGCGRHLAALREKLRAGGEYTTSRIDLLDGVQSALSNVYGVLSLMALPSWPFAPEHSSNELATGEEAQNNHAAKKFDAARATLQGFVDMVRGWLLASDATSTRIGADAKQDLPDGTPGYRSWTQIDLDSAIRTYKADRAAAYSDLCEAVKSNRPGLKKKAREIWGRNAIARALGVKSKSMVSKSPAWIAIAQDLGLPLNRNRRALGTRHTQRSGKVGYDIAVEEKSAKSAKKSDDTPVEKPSETAERQETIRRINTLANSGRSANEKISNQSAAEALLKSLQRGECTDAQAREVVEMALDNLDY